MKIRLIEVLFLAVAFAVGILCGRWAGSEYGKLGQILGFVIGTIASLMFLFFLGYLLESILNWCHPFFPICKKGKCSHRNYTFIKPLDNEFGAIFSCKCKTKYILRSDKPGHFTEALELLDDGTTRPYMKYIRRFAIFGRWDKATAEKTAEQ